MFFNGCNIFFSGHQRVSHSIPEYFEMKKFLWKNECHQNIYAVKSRRLGNVMFCVLFGTNAMSGKTYLLQKKIRFHSPFNIFINCRNHRLALCLPHLAKDTVIGELLPDYDTLLLGLVSGKCFTIKFEKILENIQII